MRGRDKATPFSLDLICDSWISRMGSTPFIHLFLLYPSFFLKEVLMIDYSKSFLNDTEKMVDFLMLPKQEFLKSYSYITDEEYITTLAHFAEVYDLWI